MTISFPCATCGHEFEVDLRHAGKKAKCKKCETIFVIPIPHTPRKYQNTQSKGSSSSSSSSHSQASYKAARSGEFPVESPAPRGKPAASSPAPSGEFDPFGFDEDQPGTKDERAGAFDDSGLEELPRYPRPISRENSKGKKTRNSESAFDISPFLYLIWIGVYAATFGLYFSGSMPLANLMYVTIVSISMGVVGSIGTLVTAFRESIREGLSCLFIPLYTLYYIITRWNECKHWAGIQICAFAMGVVFLVYFKEAGKESDLDRVGIAPRNGVASEEIFGAESPKGLGRITDTEREKFAKSFIGRAEEVTRLLETVQNAADARGISARYATLLREHQKDRTRAINEPTLKKFDDPGLNQKYLEEAKKVGARLKAEVDRLVGIPGVRLALRLSELGEAVREIHFNDLAQPGHSPTGPPLPGVPPGFGGMAVDIKIPADAVTVEVSGVVDQETREAFQARFDEHRTLFASGSGVNMTYSGGTLTYKIWPIANVHDFADHIDFAKVINVAPKSIRLQAAPLAAAERRPKGQGQDLDGVIFDLKSKIANKQRDGIRALQGIPPNDRRAEIAGTLESLLSTSDIFIKADAARLLGLWGSKENTKALADALADPQGNVRGATLGALQTIKDPSCAEAVAFLLNTNDRNAAADTLRALGPEAEPAVLKYLESSDIWARVEACKILRVIGTDACVAPLQNLYRRVNAFGLDADAAKEALLEHNAGLTPQGRGARGKVGR